MHAMKVCFITTSHRCLDDRIFYKEALSLRKAGYRVSILSCNDRCNEVKSGVTLLGFKSKIRIVKFFKLFLMALKENADVYSAHSFEALIVAFMIKTIRRKVCIIHNVREFYLDERFIFLKKTLLTKMTLPLLRALDKKINQTVDFIVGVEEPKIVKYLNYGISAQKVLVVENYVRLDLFNFMPKKFDQSNLVLGYVGGLSYAKGTKDIITSAVSFAKKYGVRVKVLLVGKFLHKEEENDLTSYYKKIREYVDIEIKGWVPHHEVSKEIGRMDICFVVFSDQSPEIRYYEKVLKGRAGPIKLYEYMACGKPVIATDFNALKYVVEKENCGCVINRKDGVSGIVKAIEFYYKNPEQIYLHGKNGRLAVEARYNWSISEKKLLKIYGRLRDGHSKNREPTDMV